MNIVLQVVLIALCILFFGYLAMYSSKVINSLANSSDIINKIYFKIFGKVVRDFNVKLTRSANLNKKSKAYKIYAYFDEIITNLDMKEDNVTVSGLLIFLTAISVSLGLLLCLLIGTLSLLLPLTCAVFYLVVTIFKLLSLIKYEQREAEIMDAVDLLVSDVRGGVYNSILRYRDSFHPHIQPYFLDFIDDVQNKGFSFKQAMLILNHKLGANFTDFAQKAILYEDKADDTMEDIFSSIIELNRQRRELRYINNIKFAELRSQFLVSLAMIMGYALFTLLAEPFIANFFIIYTFGKLMLIFDIVLVSWVLSYITAIKAKSL